MLRFFGILFTTTCIIACSHGDGDKEQTESSGVNLFLGKLQIPFFDSISVHVSATDMADIHLSKNSFGDNIKIEGIPEGETRKFEVKVYADYGKLVQEGEAIADIKADESIIIPITLNALFGFLKLEIPIGFTNNTGVSSGKLFLADMEFEMKFEIGKGVFNTRSLPLNKKLLLKIELYDENEELLFTGEKEITLHSISQNETIQLHSIKGSATLELTASSDGPTQILAILPASAYGKRTPQNYGDIFFTEIYANPTENDYFQYLELYNSTSDTMQFSNYCKIVRMDNGAEHKITDLTIPPMSYAIIGRNSVLNKDYSCGTFTLLKTEMSLGLFCGNSAIDTLAYSNKGDNKFPLEKGVAMQLPLANFANRNLGTSWCFGFSPKQDALCQ
jgi:hypothetical protein